MYNPRRGAEQPLHDDAGRTGSPVAEPRLTPATTVGTDIPPGTESGSDALGGKIVVRAVSKRFGDGREAMVALADASLSVDSSEFVTIIGPSGCGKSTLFNVIAGLTTPTSGTVSMDGRRIDGEPGHVGYMMQRDGLMQWRTILDNVVLGLECIGVGRAEARQRARAHMAKFGLAGFERRYPSALSGGMRQRAALLRTLLLDREVMLLDEPFGALDAITRSEMQEWLLSIWGEYRRTIIFITHDVEEAIYLSDRVYVMRGPPGRISAEVHIDLPRPRVYEEVVGLPEFTHTKQRLLHLVKEDPAAT